MASVSKIKDVTRMVKVCKDVGHDGQGFYCLRCGKAGYRSEAAARGHLAQCRGRAIGRGVPAPVASVKAEQSSLGFSWVGAGGSVPVAEKGALGAAAGGGGGGGLATSSLPNMTQSGSAWQGDVNSRLAALENEYTHLLTEKNQPTYHSVQQSFFSQYKSFLIIGVIVFVMIMLERGSWKCGEEEGKGTEIGSLGKKAMGKLIDASITRGVSALLKS